LVVTFLVINSMFCRFPRELSFWNVKAFDCIRFWLSYCKRSSLLYLPNECCVARTVDASFVRYARDCQPATFLPSHVARNGQLPGMPG